MSIRPADVARALRENGYKTPDGAWWFGDPNALHSETDALAIVEACLILGQPVTDLATSQAWVTLVRRVATLEDQIRELRGEDRR